MSPDILLVVVYPITNHHSIPAIRNGLPPLSSQPSRVIQQKTNSRAGSFVIVVGLVQRPAAIMWTSCNLEVRIEHLVSFRGETFRKIEIFGSSDKPT
jgi:hypothetical protein